MMSMAMAVRQRNEIVSSLVLRQVVCQHNPPSENEVMTSEASDTVTTPNQLLLTHDE